MVYGLPLVPRSDQDWIIQSLYEHAAWLLDPEHIVKGNHGLHQHQGLFVLSRLFRSETWSTTAMRRLEEAFVEAFDEEGMNNEGSLSYHLLNLKWWRQAWQRVAAEDLPIPASVRSRLTLGSSLLHHMRRPDGNLEQLGDTDEVGLSSRDEEMLGLAASTPLAEETVKCLSEGFIFGRSGWGASGRNAKDETFYSVRFGDTKKSHGHDDGGAVTFYSSGSQWLSDSGRYSYQTHDAMRKYMRSRIAHNVVDIPHAPYDRATRTKLRFLNLSEECDDFLIENTGYRGTTVLRRVVYLRRLDAMLVIDDISADTDVDIRQLWHVPYGVKVARGESRLYMARDQARTTLQFLDSVATNKVSKAKEGKTVGWISPAWKKALPGVTISRETRGDRARLAVLISTRTDGTELDAKILKSDRVLQLELRDGTRAMGVGVSPRSVWTS